MEYTEKIYLQFEKDLLSSNIKDREEILTNFDGTILYLTYDIIDVTLKITTVVFSLGSSDLWYGHIALNDPEFDLIFILARAKTTESSEF